MHHGQLSLFRDCFPFARSLSAVPLLGPSTARSLAEFLCPYTQSGTNSARMLQQDSPRYVCAPRVILPSQEFEPQLGRPIAGEEGRRRSQLLKRNGDSYAAQVAFNEIIEMYLGRVGVYTTKQPTQTSKLF